MDKLTVIMLGHKSLVGKDTFYSFVSKAYPGVAARLAFADKLKSTVADLYGFSHDQMHGGSKDIMDDRYPNLIDPKKVVSPEWECDDINLALDNGVKLGDVLVENPEYKPLFTPRRILQIFGQQQRSLYPDIWASYVFNSEIAKQASLGKKVFVITDFRFRNEAKVGLNWARTTGNTLSIVKINRPSVTALSGASDISENDLNDFTGWDHILNNTGSINNYEMDCLQLFDLIVNSQ